MKALITPLAIAFFIAISGCSNSNSTSSGGGTGIELSRTETNMTTETGETVYVVYDHEGTAGEAVTLLVKFRKEGVVPGVSTGTIHWGDLTDARVRDGMQIKHVYDLPGTYRIALEPDGGGEKVLVATIVVAEAPVETGETDYDPSKVYSVVVAVPGSPGIGFGDGLFMVEAIQKGGGKYQVNIVNPDNDSFRTGVLSTDGTPGILVSNPTCNFGGRDFNASIISISEEELVIRIDRNFKADLDFTLPRAPALGLSVANCT